MHSSEREHCKTILKKHYLSFFKKRNVTGLAFGHKIINGANTKEPCLKIFVKEKSSPSLLNSNDLIPKIYHGIKTDVVQSGKLSYSSLKEKKLPMQFGYSLGNAHVKDVGSSACLVKDKCGNLYILSTNHVLSYFDRLPVGTPILHPGVNDGGKYPDDLIAILSKKIPIISSPNDDKFINHVDCAIAKVINPNLVSKEIAFLGKVTGVSDAKLNLNIKKVGRTTELTTGIITELDAILTLEDSFGNDTIFHNQIITTFMSSKGDSGSLVLDNNNNAIGLLFGNGESISMVNPIKSVLTALDVSIVTS